MQRALLQYRDPKNWPLVRQALLDAGRTDLIGRRKVLVPPGEMLYPLEKARNKKASANVKEKGHVKGCIAPPLTTGKKKPKQKDSGKNWRTKK